MEPLLTLLEPQPHERELPPLFPSPFDALGPHALARRAAEALQAQLRAGELAPGLGAALLDAPEGGKMFGVLVVQASGGRVGFLRAFSGMLAGRWDVEGYVPPLFDRAAREGVEPEAERTVKALLARAEALRNATALQQAREEDEAQQRRHAQALALLRTRHEARKQQRHARRLELSTSDALSAEALREALHALDQESRGDKAERRRLEAAQEAERREVAPVRARLERRLGALERLGRIVSRGFMRRIHETYAISSARGERRPLRALYAPAEPPSGAADCAAPKLLAFALAHGLTPLALAEFWWGAPPAAGGRVSGAYYGACRDKCGPLLPFMLSGLEVAAPRAFTPPALAPAALEGVFEDAWLVVVRKPEGLLSVPAKDLALTDSALARLQARYPGAQLAHRLDLDTSGLLVAARDSRTYVSLQRQFAGREVEKRYVAWVEGAVRGERGTVELPLRVDVDDRPRQIHDPVHGKPAVTDWEVLSREPSRGAVPAHRPHAPAARALRAPARARGAHRGRPALRP